jgi:hypothetical protein
VNELREREKEEDEVLVGFFNFCRCNRRVN